MTFESSQNEDILVSNNLALYDTQTAGYGLELTETLDPIDLQSNSIISDQIAIEPVDFTPLAKDNSNQIVFIDSAIKDS